MTVYTIIAYESVSRGVSIPFSHMSAHLVIAGAVAIFSDLRGKNTWFGTAPCELTDAERSNATSSAALFSIGAIVLFTSTNFYLYAS